MLVAKQGLQRIMNRRIFLRIAKDNEKVSSILLKELEETIIYTGELKLCRVVR